MEFYAAIKKSETPVYADMKSSPRPPGYFNSEKEKGTESCTQHDPFFLNENSKLNDVYHWEKGTEGRRQDTLTFHFFYLSILLVLFFKL